MLCGIYCFPTARYHKRLHNNVQFKLIAKFSLVSLKAAYTLIY